MPKKAASLAAKAPQEPRSGFVAVVGRPNVGKSLLVNRLVGDKASIVSHRRQTTRGVIRAIGESAGGQVAWLDSPGWQTRHGGAFNRALNAAAEWAAEAADVTVFVCVAGAWTRADEEWLARLPATKPVLAVLNKIDRIANKDKLLPLLDELSRKRDFAALLPVSAKNGSGAQALLQEAQKLLPAGGALFPVGARADEDRDFFFAELLREKLFRALGDELPYCVGALTESVTEEPKLLRVAMKIYVEKETQKRMIIGAGGERLKRIATAARLDMQRSVGKKIFLSVRAQTEDWRNNPALLKKMRIGATQ